MATSKDPKQQIVTWSTKAVEQFLDDLDNGIERKDNPFYFGNTMLRRPNLLYEYTQEEINELIKCKNDVNYFANHYAYTKSAATGTLEHITLRDYQEDLLNTINENRFTIIVASRQSGKCSVGNVSVCVVDGDEQEKNESFINLFNSKPTLLCKIKKWLYKIYGRQCLLKNIIGYLIQFAEYIENRNLEVYDNKFLDEHKMDIMLKTDTGVTHASKIYKTKPFNVYEVVFVDGTRMECADNHIFFTKDLQEVYCKDLVCGDVLYGETDKIVKSVNKHNYKFCMYDITVDDDNHRYYTNGILSHNTISSSIYLAWYVLFNYDKTCFLCANKEKTARDVLGKVQDVLLNVPFFMKPGIVKWGGLECKFENGCRLIGEATTPRSGIGFTIHCLYLDEFAHIEKGIIDEFFDNIFPTVSSLSDSKIIVTSTPNGMNRFYEIYSAATKGINSFVPFRIDWWQVPQWDTEKKCWVKRDEQWKEKMIADLGAGDEELGRERFGAQYGNSFLATGNLLLGPNALKTLEGDKEVFKKIECSVFDYYDIEEGEYFLVREGVEAESLKHDKKFRLLSVDLSEGNGGDNLIINMFDMFVMDEKDWDKIITPSSVYDFVGLEQTGIFAYNKMHLSQFSKLLYILSHIILEPDNTRVVLEWNAFGGEVLNNLKTVFGERNDFMQSIILRFRRTLDSEKLDFGLRLNADNKKILCQDCKRNIGVHRMVLHDTNTIEEFNLFGRTRGGSYAAITGHDDRVMSCVDANAFFDTRDFRWFSDYVIDESGKSDLLYARLQDIGNDTNNIHINNNSNYLL